MRQKFDSYDDYRQVVDELESRLTKIIDEHKWREQLERELLKIIAWADKNNIPQDRLPRDTEELCNLGILYLNDRKLTHLPDSIGELSQLTELSVSHNQLTHLPDSIGELSQLTKLDVDNNQLTHIPDSIGKLTNLRELNIRGNPLVRYNLDGETVYTNDIIKKAFESKREEDAKIINRIKRFFS